MSDTCEACGQPITRPEVEWVDIDGSPPRHLICGECFDLGICFWRDERGALHMGYRPHPPGSPLRDLFASLS